MLCKPPAPFFLSASYQRPCAHNGANRLMCERNPLANLRYNPRVRSGAREGRIYQSGVWLVAAPGAATSNSISGGESASRSPGAV